MKSNKSNKSSKPKNRNNSSSYVSDENFIVSVLSCIHRTNIRFITNLPTRIKGYFLRKINEYKNQPKRTEINKVYVLVGYTTKQNIDNRFNDEHLMIFFRRFLLIIIGILLLIIAIQWIRPLIVVDQYKQIFGIESVEEMTSNDPFNDNADTASLDQNISNNDI